MYPKNVHQTLRDKFGGEEKEKMPTVHEFHGKKILDQSQHRLNMRRRSVWLSVDNGSAQHGGKIAGMFYLTRGGKGSQLVGVAEDCWWTGGICLSDYIFSSPVSLS